MQRFYEKRLQQQEEDKWLQSMQAEADADPRNQYWVAAHLKYLSVLHCTQRIMTYKWASSTFKTPVTG